jgi:hypothetical protein
MEMLSCLRVDEWIFVILKLDRVKVVKDIGIKTKAILQAASLSVELKHCEQPDNCFLMAQESRQLFFRCTGC